MDKPTCAGCRFFSPDDAGFGPNAWPHGECHRQAPMPVHVSMSERKRGPEGWDNILAFVRWPWIMADDWCGEFQPSPILAAHSTTNAEGGGE